MVDGARRHARLRRDGRRPGADRHSDASAPTCRARRLCGPAGGSDRVVAVGSRPRSLGAGPARRAPRAHRPVAAGPVGSPVAHAVGFRACRPPPAHVARSAWMARRGHGGGGCDGPRIDRDRPVRCRRHFRPAPCRIGGRSGERRRRRLGRLWRRRLRAAIFHARRHHAGDHRAARTGVDVPYG